MDEDERWLSRGWDWLAVHEDDPRHAAMEATWLRRLKAYEQAYRLAHGGRGGG